MPHTSLLRAITALAEEHRTAERLGMSPDALRATRAAASQSTDRRTFLKRTAAAGIGIVAASALSGARPAVAASAGDRIPVAIVGGGIAGLAAALRLADKGVEAQVFEASDRVGGRMRSDTTNWLDGQVSEWGGELIDTGHKTIRALAQRFRLDLVDLPKAEPRGTGDTFYFDSAPYPKADADRDFAPVYRAAVADLRAAGYPTTWETNTAAGRDLDAMSLYAWIEQRIPGGHGSRMGQLLDVAYNIEFGAETTDQSALNLIYLLGYGTSAAAAAFFGVSDERYHIVGGNDQLPRAIASALPVPVQTGWVLRAIT